MGSSVKDEGESQSRKFEDNGQELLPTQQRVRRPARSSLAKTFKKEMKEIFFPDDPFRQFKNRSKLEKAKLGVETVFPILGWGRNYSFKLFKGDLVAGLTIASLCIPQDIGYAKLANVEPQYGLYTSAVPPLIYAALGSSRDIAIGPVAVVSILLGNMISQEVPDTKSVDYHRLILTSTFFAGVFQAALGFLRLGFVIDFLSHASIVGFMAGAAITIALQQLKGLLGIKHFTNETDIISVMKAIWGTVHHGWNWQTIVIGVSFLFLLQLAKFIGKKRRKLFWVPAITPLISVILATLIVFLTRADKHGVNIVKHIRKGINTSSADELVFTGQLLGKSIKVGFVAGLIALTEAIAIGRTFAGLKDYNLDGNKEMCALGVMNICGSLTSCYVATGSFSRSAVNYNAGCQTAMSNIVMSIVVFLTLQWITPLFYYTPNAILSSIIISAVISLIDIEAARLIWKVDKMDFLACLGAFLGVIFVSVEIGLLIAVCLSLAKILLQVTRPHTAKLGKIPETNIFRNIDQYPDAVAVPGMLIVRIDSAIYFSNANYVRERIIRWVNDEEEKIENNGATKLQFLILEMSPIIDIDTSGIHALEEIDRMLLRRDIKLVFANPGRAVTEKLHCSHFVEKTGQDSFFLTAGDAVKSCSSHVKYHC